MAINATDLARVKAWQGTTGQDAVNVSATKVEQLNQLIPAVSRAIEAPGLLNRALEAAERTEVVYTRKLRNRKLSLRHGPVTAGETFTLKADVRADWTNATTLVAGTDYVVDEPASIVRFVLPRLGPTHFQVTYTAGLAADLDALAAAYPDIVQAATLWVAEIFKRREQLTATADGVGNNGQITFSRPLQHPPAAVKGLLDPYRWGPFSG